MSYILFVNLSSYLKVYKGLLKIFLPPVIKGRWTIPIWGERCRILHGLLFIPNPRLSTSRVSDSDGSPTRLHHHTDVPFRLFYILLVHPKRQVFTCRWGCAKGLSLVSEKRVDVTIGHVNIKSIATEAIPHVFRPANHKRGMPAESRPCLIPHWQSFVTTVVILVKEITYTSFKY